MASDPKGVYYSPTGTETGWATVLPQSPHRSYANLFYKDMAARQKAKDAEDKAKKDALAKLSGVDVGKFHHEVYKKALVDLIDKAPGMDTFELQSNLVKLDAAAKATKDVAKIYDADIKWSEQKDIPLNRGEYQKRYKEYYANPTLESAAQLAESPPDKMFFLNEEGGSKYIDAPRATKMVINDNFKGYALDNTEWTRGNWDKAPIGYVADINTFQTKVQAFSKYDPKTNEIVIKGTDALQKEGILDTFMSNEYTKKVIDDGALAIVADRKGIKPEQVDPLDVTDEDRATALQGLLRPYVQGVVAERGMSIAIRPSSSGMAAAGKDQRFTEGFNLWVKQLSQGSSTAARFPSGGKLGQTSEEIVMFDPVGLNQTSGQKLSTPSGGPITGVASSVGGQISILTDAASVRRNFEGQDWFKNLNDTQKQSIVDQTITSSGAIEGKPNVVYTLVTRTPTGSDKGPKYDYRVLVFDPEQTDASTLRLLYDAGYAAGGNVHYNVIVGNKGTTQMGNQYEQAKGWSPSGGQQQTTKSKNPLGL